MAAVQRLPEMSARKEITMAENNAPSLADILIAIPKLSDPDLKKLREALPREEIDVWMNAPAEEALKLQRPLPDNFAKGCREGG
jgi:hypothetical protein